MTKYWLFKSEPETFGIDHLAQCKDQTEPWNGVRNYQVRNMLRDDIKTGDLGFFYHSNCNPPGIAGIVRVVKDGYGDDAAWDVNSPYYDPKSTPQNPRWYMVDVKLVERFQQLIPLQDIKRNRALETMQILRPGNRLSITPVSEAEWKAVLKMRQGQG